MRSDGAGIRDGHEHTNIGHCPSESAVATHHAANLGSNFFRILQGAHEICADVPLCIATANRKDEDQIRCAQLAATQPIGIHRIPTLVVGSRRELRYIVAGRVCLDIGNLPEVANRMGSMSGSASDSKKKHPPVL